MNLCEWQRQRATEFDKHNRLASAHSSFESRSINKYLYQSKIKQRTIYRRIFGNSFLCVLTAHTHTRTAHTHTHNYSATFWFFRDQIGVLHRIINSVSWNRSKWPFEPTPEKEIEAKWRCAGTPIICAKNAAAAGDQSTATKVKRNGANAAITWIHHAERYACGSVFRLPRK